MKYVTPEMKISMFASESVATEASKVNPNLVAGLQEMDPENVKTVKLNEMKTITKFVY